MYRIFFIQKLGGAEFFTECVSREQARELYDIYINIGFITQCERP